MDFLDNSATNLLITTLIAVVVGIGVNLLTPKIQEWRAKRSLNGRLKRIEKLENELKRLEAFIVSPTYYIAYCVRESLGIF